MIYNQFEGDEKMRVIGIGDNVCDKYEHLRLMFPGGQAANFAVYAGMLGAESAYMGVFGRDEVAEHVTAGAVSMKEKMVMRGLRW